MSSERAEALTQANLNTQSFSIINVQLDKLDPSEALARLDKRLVERLRRNASSRG